MKINTVHGLIRAVSNFSVDYPHDVAPEARVASPSMPWLRNHDMALQSFPVAAEHAVGAYEIRACPGRDERNACEVKGAEEE